jgi:Zn-finger nucleic acid-binding protein
MQCPIDQTTLVISERQGIEIDYCPKCRGVWLDRGELDKIIERTSEIGAAPVASRDAQPTRPQESSGRMGKISEAFRDRDHDDDDDYTTDRQGRRKKKRGGFLDDLFDF